MNKNILHTMRQFFAHRARPKAKADHIPEEPSLEQAALQEKREKRFSTHDEEHYLGRDMVARWKAHRLWG